MPTDAPDLIKSDDSQLGKMTQILESAGYVRSEDADPGSLGAIEYAVAVKAGRKMLILGQGRPGDESCYTVLYFTIDSEELVEHASCTE